MKSVNIAECSQRLGVQRKSPKTVRRGQAGVSLVETIVALGILGIVVATTASYFGNAFRQDKRQKLKVVRETIRTQIETAAENPESILRSSQHTYGNNEALEACIHEDGTACTVTHPGNASGCPASSPQTCQAPIYLMSPTAGSDSGANIVGSRPGDSTVGVYNHEGELGCSSMDGETCPFKVNAYFWATCPVPDMTADSGASPTTCDAAETIHVRYQVRDRRAGSSNLTDRGVRTLANYPPDPEFSTNKTSYATSVQVKDIKMLSETSCDPGQRVVGYDTQGRAVCECVGGCNCSSGPNPSNSEKTCVELSNCNCADSKCDPDLQFLVGFDENNQAECQERCTTWEDFNTRPECSSMCYDIIIQNDSSCNEGEQMVRIDYGACYAADTHTKGPSKADIYCNEDRATCCPAVY